MLVPGVFSSAYSFCFAYGRQIFAMSRSGLLPPILSLTHSKTGTPWVAMTVGSALGFLICVFGTFELILNFREYQQLVYCMMLTVAITNYIFQLSCFIILRVQFKMLTRKFNNRTGVIGASLSIIIFFIALLGQLGFTDPVVVRYSSIGLIVYFAIGMGYYTLHARKNLIISPEEQFVSLI